MQVVKVQDKHTNAKVWVVKISKCGHYYVNQEINGRLFYRRFARLSKRYLSTITGLVEGRVLTGHNVTW